MFEKTEWAIKNEQSRETGSFLHKTQNEDKQTKKQHRKLKRWARFLTNIYVINSHCSNEHNKDWNSKNVVVGLCYGIFNCSLKGFHAITFKRRKSNHYVL